MNEVGCACRLEAGHLLPPFHSLPRLSLQTRCSTGRIQSGTPLRNSTHTPCTVSTLCCASDTPSHPTHLLPPFFQFPRSLLGSSNTLLCLSPSPISSTGRGRQDEIVTIEMPGTYDLLFLSDPNHPTIPLSSPPLILVVGLLFCSYCASSFFLSLIITRCIYLSPPFLSLPTSLPFRQNGHARHEKGRHHSHRHGSASRLLFRVFVQKGKFFSRILCFVLFESAFDLDNHSFPLFLPSPNSQELGHSFLLSLPPSLSPPLSLP